MADLTKLPLEDNFKTSLSQAWDGSTGTINVTGTPNFTFPSGVTTYIVANPGKSNMQIAEINAYSSGSKTITVSNITLEKGASVNSTAQSHAVGSEIIISDNYQFWADIQTAINSKLDDDSDFAWDSATDFAGIITKSLTTAQREALTGVNGMIVFDSTAGVHYQYIGGAWSTFATGSVVNASTTVAGKVEVSTDAEVTAGTGIGGTGAILSVTPTQANTLVSLATTDTTSSDTDYYMFQDAAASDVNKRITQANLRDTLAASTTAKGTSELSTDAEAVTGTDTTRHINPFQLQQNIGATGIIASDTLQASADTERNTTSATYVKIKEFLLGNYVDGGTVRVKFDLKTDLDAGEDTVAFGRIYKNGGAFGTEQSTELDTFQNFSEDLTFAGGDLIQLYIKRTTTTGGGNQAVVQNFRIYYDEVITLKTPIVNTD